MLLLKYLSIIHLWCIINKTKLLEQLKTLISLIVTLGSDIDNRPFSLYNFLGELWKIMTFC